jgi:hypothetical protein
MNNTILLIILAGLTQGVNILTLGFLFILFSIILTTELDRRRLATTLALYLTSFFITNFFSTIFFLQIFLYIPYISLIYIIKILSILMMIIGALILISNFREIQIISRALYRNPLIKTFRKISGRGLLTFSPVLGALTGISVITCPCSLPLLPAVASYIISKEIHESIHMALLYSLSTSLPMIIIVSTLSIKKIFRKIYDLVMLNIFRIKTLFSILMIFVSIIIFLTT